MPRESGYTFEQLQEILEEIATYQVELEEDPTQIHLGTRYLQQKIAECRRYLNRVQFYLQRIGKYERELKLELQIQETDIDFKINGMLADDPVVKQQPTLDERKAVAIATLKAEYEVLTGLKRKLLDAQETTKLLKMKYGDLRATNADIKAQRQLVKDDMAAWTGGDEGYTAPRAKQDGTMDGGMAPPITRRIDPNDILDPDKRPEDLPEPKDEIHAQQIASFFNTNPPKKPEKKAEQQEESEDSTPVTGPMFTYDDLLKD